MKNLSMLLLTFYLSFGSFVTQQEPQPQKETKVTTKKQAPSKGKKTNSKHRKAPVVDNSAPAYMQGLLMQKNPDDSVKTKKK